MAGPRLAFTVASRATGAREARALLRTWLAARSCAQDVIEVAELLVTELVSNALKHTDSAEVDLSAHLQGRRVRVEVGDGLHQGPPAPPTDVSANDVAGRGLWLVEQLAEVWGWHPQGDGKRVWFELTCPQVWPAMHDE